MKLIKQRDLVKLIESNGWRLKKHGGNHDLYTNGTIVVPIPRHSEINERLAQHILKQTGVNK